jgi:O-antigen ligase
VTILRAIPSWLRFVIGLALVLFAIVLKPSGVATISFILGAILLGSAKVQAFTEANDAHQKWKERRRNGTRDEE